MLVTPGRTKKNLAMEVGDKVTHVIHDWQKADSIENRKYTNELVDRVLGIHSLFPSNSLARMASISL